MKEEEKKVGQVALKEKPMPSPATSLQDNIAALAKYGGFDAVATSLEGANNMTPGKAKTAIFLAEEQYREERKLLKKRLRHWHDLLAHYDEQTDMAAHCDEKSIEAKQLLVKNLKTAVKTARPLERNYRTVLLFFKNTEEEKIHNLTLMNASPEQLKDLDVSIFIDEVAYELRQNYDRLDLRGNYSLIVLPGFPGSNKVLEKWAKICHENKAMLITDYRHLNTAADVMEMFDDDTLAGGDAFRTSVIMTCNWLVGRGRYTDLEETENLFVPPSAALAGKIYYNVMSQVSAGVEYGTIAEVDGVCFETRKSEAGDLEKLALVPMVKEWSKVTAMSARTLYNGDNAGLRTYSVVRVFDWIGKVLMDFLNRRTFENINVTAMADIKSQIERWMNTIQGPGKLIEKFSVEHIRIDPVQKDKVYVDIRITPFFPARSFMIKLTGTRGDAHENNRMKFKAEVEN